MSLRVLEAGLYSLLVDQGRPGYRALGVPVGGAADRAALALGNALVGNAPDACALEVCLTGPVLQAECSLACVVFGAPFVLTRIRPKPPGKRRSRGFEDSAPATHNQASQNLSPGKTFTLDPGDQLHIGTALAGMRAYLCVHGGFQAPRILNSQTALQPLRAGDVLPCSQGKIHARFLPAGESFELFHPPASQSGTVICSLRVLEGLQAGWFEEKEFYGQEMTVTSASNRMGLRLQGHPLTWPGREMVSEAVCPGTVQVTRDGRCIILGVDGQTIGGYPKIAQVILADLDYLAQLRPGDRVRFARLELEEAAALWRKRQAELEHWVLRLRTTFEGWNGSRSSF